MSERETSSGANRRYCTVITEWLSACNWFEFVLPAEVLAMEMSHDIVLYCSSTIVGYQGNWPDNRIIQCTVGKGECKRMVIQTQG